MVRMLSLLETSHHPDQAIAWNSTRSISAGTLGDKARALAEELRNLGVSVLALQLDNGIDWLIADLASQLASICLVPIPGYFSTSQLEHVLTQAPVDAYMGDGINRVEALLGKRVKQRRTTQVEVMPLLLLEPSAKALALPPQSGKITFTSGSTGTPKGVCLSHQQLQKQARVLAERVALSKPKHLCLLPLSTLLENVAGVYVPLIAGGQVMLPGLAEIGFEGSSALNSQKLVQTISRYEPDSIIITPQLLLVLVAAVAKGWRAPASLKFVAVGGSKPPASLLQQAQLAGIPAFEGYGLSECASVVSLNTPTHSHAGTCGRPLPHVQLRIEDDEIVVRGNAMLGYLGEPESWGQGQIRTGDLGYINEQGYVVIKGRSKNLLISSYGRNINPEWVESELLSRPLLSECVVLGDARPYCVALLSPRQADASDESIQQHIDRINLGLPDYARVKRWHRLSQSLQHYGLLTANGRPKRAAIAEHFAPLLDTLYPETYQLESA